MSLQEISDRLEIQELIARYSVALDTRDYDGLDDLFTDDAVLDYTATGAIRGGLAEMKQFIADAFAMFDGTQHLTTSTTLAFDDDGNTAHGNGRCGQHRVVTREHVEARRRGVIRDEARGGERP